MYLYNYIHYNIYIARWTSDVTLLALSIYQRCGHSQAVQFHCFFFCLLVSVLFGQLVVVVVVGWREKPVEHPGRLGEASDFLAVACVFIGVVLAFWVKSLVGERDRPS